MNKVKKPSMKARIAHRYLGYFLTGIMAVYAISGITLIFRDSDTFKKEVAIEKTLEPNVNKETLGKALGIKKLAVSKEENGIYYFETGTYNTKTGVANYTKKELPYILNKITKFHKAKSGDPLFFLNIFFGLALLFFVISAFWMFLPSSPIFKKGLYFALAGALVTVILLFV
ncbi:hypothetical protein [Spongiivirga citrea]|nr:hypothetical protein [Spongiivirga citrea]